MDPDIIVLGIPDIREASLVYGSPSRCDGSNPIDYMIFGYYTATAAGYIAVGGEWKRLSSAYVLTNGAWKQASLLSVEYNGAWKASI